MKPHGPAPFLVPAVAVAMAFCGWPANAEELRRGETYSAIEIAFAGPRQTARDAPARDIDLQATFRHERGQPEYVLRGFWDGDGAGGASGNVFKVRFCPTQPGRWDLLAVASNAPELHGQKVGGYVTAAASAHPGFWYPDPDSPDQRWYRRSDGSHPYIFGNTHYSFLSGYRDGDRPSGNDIAADIAANARHFKKLRFSLYADRYPHPTEKPFLDDRGQPTDAGAFSHRPNPAWFHGRVDRAVQAAYGHDLIADLILAGPDTQESRSTLLAAGNQHDPTPFLKYIAARYGSYPHVWLCLCNEYDIKQPKYTDEKIAQFGQALRGWLPYPTPLSVHAAPETWSAGFDALPPWNDHQIIQHKLRTLGPAADAIGKAGRTPAGESRRRPTVNDELSYQGAGDKHTEQDTIEAHLGAFLGGGYATTGEKYGNKLGQYFWGKFDPAEHTAADNLAWLRETIDRHIAFWRMAPARGCFQNLAPGFRALAWEGREYVLGTNEKRQNVIAELPEGVWTVTRHDAIGKTSHTLATGASGRFVFDAPDSRAVLFHFRKADTSPAP